MQHLFPIITVFPNITLKKKCLRRSQLRSFDPSSDPTPSYLIILFTFFRVSVSYIHRLSSVRHQFYSAVTEGPWSLVTIRFIYSYYYFVHPQSSINVVTGAGCEPTYQEKQDYDCSLCKRKQTAKSCIIKFNKNQDKNCKNSTFIKCSYSIVLTLYINSTCATIQAPKQWSLIKNETVTKT